MFKKNFIVSCTNTECYRKDCPNYSNRVLKDSFNFPDCIERIRNEQMGQKIPQTSK